MKLYKLEEAIRRTLKHPPTKHGRAGILAGFVRKDGTDYQVEVVLTQVTDESKYKHEYDKINFEEE